MTDNLASLYNEGHSVAQIAHRTGLSTGTVYNRLKQAGVQMRPQGRKSGFSAGSRWWQLGEKAYRLRVAGWSWVNIGAECGVSHQAANQAAYAYAERAGLPPLPRERGAKG